MDIVAGALAGFLVSALAIYPFFARPVVRELDDAGAVELRHGWLRVIVGSVDVLVVTVLVAVCSMTFLPHPSASTRLYLLVLAIVVWALVTWRLIHDVLTWRIRIDHEAVTWRTGTDGEGRIELGQVRAVEPVHSWPDSNDALAPYRGTRLTARDGQTVLLPKGTPTDLLRARFPRADWSEEPGVIDRDGRVHPRRR